MADLRRQKLIDLGPEALADALLNLGVYSDTADNLIDQLVATATENIKRFNSKLSGLKRRRSFIGWREINDFARELGLMLQSLKSSVDDPLVGVELIAKFFEADSAILEMCDDSSGLVGSVFCYDARELFIDYAARCADKEKVAEIMLKVVQTDAYGVRSTLVDCAGKCLPEGVIRNMIATLQGRADKAKDPYDKDQHRRFIESLARQIKDAQLFEKMRVASGEKLHPNSQIDIAQVYLECGDVETAHAWLLKVPEDDRWHAYGRDKLLEEVYRKQGDLEKLTELLYKRLRAHPAAETLQVLLDVIGADKREEVVAEEVRQIMADERLEVLHAEFMIASGRVDEAELYLLQRADQLNGNNYIRLLALVEALEAEERHLVVSLIYRSLLISILEQGYTKAYPHGIRYLKRLDKLAGKVADWNKFGDHEAFKAQITEAHGRKRSFWSQYRDA